MTAHELARRLLAGPDYPVTIAGYEGGAHFVDTIEPPRPLALDVSDAGYLGPHAYGEADEDTILAIHLRAIDEWHRG